jgi:ribosomal protein S18 acetylase RimI-like enzyme
MARIAARDRVITVSLRPESIGDKPFLYRLITETLALELGASAWPEPMRTHLLQIQFAARRHAGLASHPGAQSCIIEADGASAGWLVLAPMPHETRIVEIMVAPEFRGKGIGSAALQSVLAKAAGAVRLNVNKTNSAAIRLYERLGFRKIEQDELQWLMEYAR